ncbi:MAG: beta-N-acetylhexosaminidase, partial [Ignavibacteriaceae bacterium]|nr:beta-N-acetylhexosaminidase [Ignavibacteriaceae bacterium]
KKEITIEALTPRGLFYGAMSLIQLLEKAADKKLPLLKIVDSPDMNVRGISDDISRGQVSTLDNFKKIIQHIARYKMNVYMPYLEDMLVFDAYPTIGVNRGALTKAEVKELVDFAAKHFVDVIPIFQTLGHYENILAQEEFLKYAEFSGAASLNVSNDSTYKFLETMLKEVFDIFPSKYFHMGADESYDVGLGKSKNLVDETNIATVHANHYKKVYDIAKKYDKTVLMYGDIILKHPEILSQLPKDIIIVDWHYRADYNYPSAQKFKEAGFEYYVSAASWNFLTTFPTNVNALPNIKNIVRSGLQNNSAGMINSNWGDYGAETFKELILFDYAWSAQCSWNLENSDIDVFSNNYFYDFFGINDDRFASIYRTMSNPLNQMMWHEVWRHPLLPFREPGWWESNVSKVVKANWMEWSLPQVKRDVAAVKPLVKKNSDHLNLIEYLLDFNDWYKQKFTTQFELFKAVEINKVEDFNSLNTLLDDNIKSLQLLKRNYKSLWLKYYKGDNLRMVEDKFDRLSAYFWETKNQLADFVSGKTDSVFSKPEISSKWIYAPTDENDFAHSTQFMYEFELASKPEEALLQLMGDTYAELFINGQYVDKVFARRSLSLLVDYKRIKFLDVAKYLKTGKNSILVAANNYNRSGVAGVNIISRIKQGKDYLIVQTNTDWKTKVKNEWMNAVSKNYPFLIIAPNFEAKRASWIER